MKKFNDKLAIAITKGIGTMWAAYIFCGLSFLSLPAVLVLVHPDFQTTFPSWLVAVSLIALITWISQNFLQLVLLPILMVGQNLMDRKSHERHAEHIAQIEQSHKHTRNLIRDLHEEHMREIKAIKEMK